MMILAVTEHTVVGPWCVFDVLQCFKTGLMAAEMNLNLLFLIFLRGSVPQLSVGESDVSVISVCTLPV